MRKLNLDYLEPVHDSVKPNATTEFWRRIITPAECEELLHVETAWLALGRGFSGEQLDPQRMIFLDIETTGLGAASMAFLVGLAYYVNDNLVVEQLLALDYPGEADVLHALHERLQNYDTIITFNGNSFDLPLLQGRFVYHKMTSGFPQERVDLCVLARRVFSRRLKRCNQQRMECELLGLQRQNDLSGSEIPGRYFRFLKEGDEGLLDSILLHNRLDVQCMAQIAAQLCMQLSQPLDCCHEDDLFDVGRLMQLSQLDESAHACYTAVQGALKSLAQKQQAELFRRQADLQNAVRLWEKMCGEKCAETYPYIALAKHYEHRLRQPDKSLAFAIKALEVCSDLEKEEIEHRIKRLQRKVIS
ncbi:MAG: ribonuclease H-like domain-containing protein [Clostridia bacterium]|nr:ribonuclease H-like domain-containing protein [Clostridia bacterium]